jgi:glycosyltransferase involved in cell wall biosynthesis
MKIAYSIENLGNSGGIERVLSTKANHLADRLHHEVHIIAGGKKPGNLFYHFSHRIIFHFLAVDFAPRKPWHYLFKTPSDRLYRKQLTQTLNEIKPDITISTFGRDAEFLYRLNDGSVKILEFHFTKNYLKHLGASLENDRFHCLRTRWLALLQKRESRIAGKYSHIVLLTERDRQLWGAGSRFTVIPNPLSFVTERASRLDQKTIVSMGRLVYPKGFQHLIRAFARIADQHPDWKIEIYGEGHDQTLLQNEINQLSLRNQISLRKPNADVESIMLKASIFVLPTLYDGFGLVLTEAMACGVPCIAFDCECGPAEIIGNNQDGLLAPLKNEAELAEKMTLLMNSETLRRQMGTRAKNNVLRFAPDVIMNKWNNYFSEITAKK